MKLRLGLTSLGALIGVVITFLIPGLPSQSIEAMVLYHATPVILGAAAGAVAEGMWLYRKTNKK